MPGQFAYASTPIAGQFGYYTSACHNVEDEYYDDDPELSGGRFVKENYDVHEDAARKSERRSREIAEERRANAAIPKMSRPKLKSKTDHSITVAWSAPGRVDVGGYDLEMRLADTEWALVWSGPDTTHEVTGLEGGTQYYFRVRARNGERVGESSQDSFYSTHGSSKPKASESEAPATAKTDREAADKKSSKKEKKD